MTSKFTYLVCCYFGARANQKYNSAMKENKFVLVEKHIEFLKSYSNDDIEKVIFVINKTENDDVDEITSYFSEKSEQILGDIEFVLLFRDNKFFSYGAWNDAIVEDLQSEDDESSYYFCLEDDYIPSSSNFLPPFIERCNEKTPYVCCKAVINHPGYIDHPSMSVGLYLKSSCKNVYDKNKFVFLVDGNNSYENAWRIQQTFYKPFIDMGYGITDILDSYSSPFLCSSTNEVKMFGEENSEVLVEPIKL